MRRSTALSAATLAAAVLVPAQTPPPPAAPVPPPAASCCAEADPVELPPLPADATDKERWLRRIHDRREDDAKNIFLSSRYIADWRKQLAELPPDAPLAQRFGLRWGLAQALVRTGGLAEAVQLCGQCEQLAASEPESTAGWLPEVLLRMAATHFRQAEKQNCIARHNADSCILPLSPRAVHVQKEGATAAAEVLERLLQLPASDRTVESSLWREAVWLLNIAHMALGDWPDGVPAAHRIPAAAFAPEAPFPHFTDRGGELGLAHHNHAGSLVVDDFTGDGRLDLVVCSFDTGRPLRLHRNDGDGGMTEIGTAAGLERQLGGSNVLAADVDGDGRLDLLVLRGGGFFAGSEFPLSLLRQDRDGHFVDVTAVAGIEFAGPLRAACFADIDRDGDLDLFLGYESEPSEHGVRFPSRLLQNDGHGRFTDITAGSGIVNADRCMGAVFGDVDGDDLPDLYLSNFMAPNRLFLNCGTGTFREAAAERGVAEPLASGPCAFVDYDQDGDLDLFVAYQHHYRQIRAVAAWYMEHRVEDDTQRLFENDGTGRFRDVTAARGLRRVAMTTGLGVGDADNDGRPDLYLATGAHDLAALFPNVLLRGGDRFADVTFAAAVGHLQKGNGVAFADLDDDGDLDLAVQVGGYHLDDGFGNVLFENPGNGNHWLEVGLRGRRDNTRGIGARVRAHVLGQDGEHDVYATVGVGGSLGSGPARAHLGLGRADRIAFVEVHWPASGLTQRLTTVPIDAHVCIDQDQAGCVRVALPPLRLGTRR